MTVIKLSSIDGLMGETSILQVPSFGSTGNPFPKLFPSIRNRNPGLKLPLQPDTLLMADVISSMVEAWENRMVLDIEVPVLRMTEVEVTSKLAPRVLL